jgi:hypothetical protein
MPEALKCPSCAAPLDYPASGGTTMHCPYCNSTVVLPGAAQQTTPENDIAAALAPLLGNAMDIPQIADLLKSGRKIEAIKIIRQTSGASLIQAKQAIDNLASGGHNIPPISSYSSSGATKLASNGMKIGCGVLMTIIPLTVLSAMFFARSMRKQLTPPAPPTWVPTIVLPAPAPVVPTFAHVTVEFGTEGIGAGQFKDSRSIAVDGRGHIYVGEYSDGRVQVFGADGKFMSEWSIGRNKSLMNLAADRHGTVFAVTPGHIFCYEGVTGLQMGEAQTTHDDVPVDYTDAFAALDGNIYTIDGNSNIVILSPDGIIKNTIKAAQNVGEDVSFFRIVVLPTGEIYMLDRTKGVFKFAPDGRYINRFGGGSEDADPAHPTPGHLTSPNNMAIDGKGRIYVSDDGPAVQVFSSDGQYLDSFGGQDVVFGLAINDQNEIFACYRNKHTIRKFVLDKR